MPASLVLVALTARVAVSGTIRHDRDDALYLALAAEPRYAAVGLVQTSSLIGSGVLIAPNWILTAGHMTDKSSTFTLGGQSYTAVAQSIADHPEEDVGLFRLDRPVAGVAPAQLYSPDFGTEVGRISVAVGYGRSGTGLTGDVTPCGTKRAGRNTIDAIGSIWGWSPNTVLTDFDSPLGKTVNHLGEAVPLDLEYCTAHGDSGGGLFVDVAGETYLAGVQVTGWQYDGTFDASYGDGAKFVRVSALFDWITATIPATLPGDATGDQVVDDRDAAVLASHWLQATSAGWVEGDLNADGSVDDRDAAILAAHWARPSHSAPLPEPGVWALLPGLLLALARFGRRNL